MPVSTIKITVFCKQLIILLSAVLFFCGCSDKKAPSASISPGELIFKKNCKVCHAQGINGAPILGNQAMWEPRIIQGEAVLIEHATHGYGLMPAKGGKTDLPNSDIALAVKFMLSKVQ